MEALIHDPEAPHGLRLGDFPDPVAAPSQALIEVGAISLNFGEVKYLAQRTKPGEVSGWDAAGTVRAAAADGSGPAVGTRVVTFGRSGGWGRLRAVDTADVAALPDNVSLAAASALPVAGVTALQAIRRLGGVIGRRVLITGASGGVGRFAVQLAHRAGADVVASVGSPARGEGLRELGADAIVIGPENVGRPVYGVLDNVGGRQLATAFGLLEPDGTALAIGKASGQDTSIDFEAERVRGGQRSLEPFNLRGPFGSDLEYLVSLLSMGGLDPQIGWHGSWRETSTAIAKLLGRQVAGKAVLDVS